MLDGHCPARVLPFGTYPLTDVQKTIRKVFFNTPLGYSRLRRPFIERFKRDCCADPVDATLFGLKVRFYPQDNQTDAKSAVCGACYNHRELKWLRRHLPKGGTFVDVGANMGFFSLYAAQREARVIAIEPNPVLFERLTTNLRLNGMQADLFRMAVGDQEGSGQLVQVNGDFGGGADRCGTRRCSSDPSAFGSSAGLRCHSRACSEDRYRGLRRPGTAAVFPRGSCDVMA